MQAALAPRGDARTFLTHFVGSGLDDERYVIQHYRSQADGDIVPIDADGRKPKGRRRPRPTVASLKQVENLRPARDEIIIATGIELATGESRGPFDTEAEAVAELAFAGLSFEEVEIVDDAPVTARFATWA